MPPYASGLRLRRRRPAFGVRRRPVAGAARGGAASVAAKALREVRKLAATRETKRLDLSLANADALGFSLNGYITNIAPIAQGLTASDRIGDTVRLKRFRCYCAMNTVTASNFTWRWMVVKDNQTRPSYTPAVSEIMTSARTTADILEVVKNRYVVLHDQTVSQNVSFAGQDGRLTHIIDIPLDHTMEWNGAASTAFQKGNVYLLLLAEMGGSTQYTALAGGEAFMGYYATTSYQDA